MAISAGRTLCVKKAIFLFEVKCRTLRIHRLIRLMNNEWIRKRTKRAVVYLTYFWLYWMAQKEQDG
jgi:hypothetical protein